MTGAQVASRRKAQHGSSRTAFHEGNGQARGARIHAVLFHHGALELGDDALAAV